MYTGSIIHYLTVAIFLILATPANAFCTEFAVNPFTSCSSQSGKCYENYTVTVDAPASYRISPGLASCPELSTCSLNMTNGLNFTIPGPKYNISLDADDEAALSNMFESVSGGSNDNDAFSVREDNYTLSLQENKSIVFPGGTSIQSYYVNSGFLYYTPQFKCIDLTLWECGNSSVPDFSTVRGCEPLDVPIPDGDAVYTTTVSGTVAAFSSSSMPTEYTSAVPTTMEPLSLSSSIAYEYGTAYATYYSVAPLPTSYTTAYPDIPATIWID